MMELTPTEDQRGDQARENHSLRAISLEELKQILDEHKKWVESEFKKGQPADLRYLRLSGFDLSNVCLRAARLNGADLSYAVLRNTNLQAASLIEANLRSADLEGAILTDAEFDNTIMEDANLAGTTGLTAEHIKSAIINWKTKLPDQLRSSAKGIPDDEWARILVEHRIWLASKGKKGHRADLRRMDLRNRDLSNLDLTGVDFGCADLTGTKLTKTKLTEADLSDSILIIEELDQTDFQNANLSHAILSSTAAFRPNLRAADLRWANMADIRQFHIESLAGTDLSNAKLPPGTNWLESLKGVEETSKIARKSFLAMMLGCIYAWLSIGTTTDRYLLTNSALSPLPLIGTTIPIVGFYWVVPILLFCLYVYFHFSLQAHWERLANLPAIFPTEKTLDEKAYPWLLNSLVRRYYTRLKSHRPLLNHLQSWISTVLAWWVVPVTNLGFWVRYLHRHDYFGTSLHAFLFVVSVSCAITLQHLAKVTFHGQRRESFSWGRILGNRKNMIWATIFLLTIIAFCVLSIGAIQGPPHGISFKSPNLASRILAAFSYSAAADFNRIDVSTKPENWSGDYYDADQVKGANLKQANLRYANAAYAFLTNADLRGADLFGADLQYADLRRADLRGANLGNANMRNAKIELADIRWTNLSTAEGLDWRRLEMVVWDSTTRLPDYVSDSLRMQGRNGGYSPYRD